MNEDNSKFLKEVQEKINKRSKGLYYNKKVSTIKKDLIVTSSVMLLLLIILTIYYFFFIKKVEVFKNDLQKKESPKSSITKE